MKHNRLYAFCCALAFAAGMVGCVADPTLDPLPDGSSTLSATVEFRPLVPTLDASTRTAGDKIKAIESLCVLLYDAQGNLVERYPLTETSDANPAPGYYKLSDEERNPGDGYPAADETDADQPIAEARTPRAAFTLPGTVPYGDYYLYAVANMGDLSDRTEAIATVEGLRSIRLTWQTDVSRDNQMFGFFTPADEVLKQAPLLRIATPATRLHAWLRRAASKVTIAYDGSELNNQVEIYIQSVELKNIPATCPLGNANEPDKQDDLIDQGERILYSESTDHTAWPVVMNERTYEGNQITDDQKAPTRTNAHGETSEALFFFENMQGTGQSKKQVWQEGQQKPQFPDGNDPSSDGYRDGKPYGTYVEVTGYYVSDNDNKKGRGPIVYRFMLGKDTDTDYNAERNFHYKLTLKFKGYGNDVDWHIDYKEEPGIHLPDPYYISYLYNQDMELPIRITPPTGYTVTGLRADIIRNEWYPSNPDGTTPSGVYYSGPYSIANGFLSMRKTQDAIIGNRGDYNTWSAWSSMKRGWREYTYDPKGDEVQKIPDATDGDYTVTKGQNASVEFLIPMYTRAKQIYPSTGYTGNNPYVAYRRMAKVEFTATFTNEQGDKQTLKETQTIWQMRRVVNPKGIWRKEGSTEPFHVVMMVQKGEEAPEFVPLESDGPWTAEIEYGKEWFDLEATPGKSTQNEDGSVSGEWGTAVDFTYRPKPGSGTQCGIILIRYNNHSCHHRIFVRRGYDPLRMTDDAGSPAWHSFNLVAKGVEASSPADDGSLFKYGNFDQAIASSNNQLDENFADQSNREFTLAGGGTAKWDQIRTGTIAKDIAHPIGDPGVAGARVASAEDYTYLIQHNHPEIEYGYGVLYEDGTTETQTKVSDAYGWNTAHPTNRGMRGCFVYNADDGRNIFFPIGVTGYGRRKRIGNGSIYVEQDNCAGVLRYATRWKEMVASDNVEKRPLFWDLYRRPGANYWAEPSLLKNPMTDEAAVICYSLDINYFTFDFTPYGRAASESWAYSDGSETHNNRTIGSDALYIRLVEDK